MKMLAFTTTIVALACTANVQDLGAPDPSTPPSPAAVEGCAFVRTGDDCGGSTLDECTLNNGRHCVCGVDAKWVCLEASTGLLSPHALATTSCGSGVTYASKDSVCACYDEALYCHALRMDRPKAETEHAP
jgi:hypothetical protein